MLRFLCILISLCSLSGCGVAYIAKSATYQFSMLSSRVSNLEARASGELTLEQRRTLDVIEEVRGFGSHLGLHVGELYGTVAMGWDHTIWNVSASKPLTFESATWWFPIVGTVPYLGFFEKPEALEQVQALKDEGLETYLRTAGAYSTLGYFEDPILPSMLQWSEWTVARVILHELTHATIWLPGSVNFNESVANFVGNAAALQFLEAKYGAQSQTLKRANLYLEDQSTWRILLKELYTDLETLYRDSSIDDPNKLKRKAQLYDSITTRVSSAPFHYPQYYLRLAKQSWNNPRLMQFRTYNNNQPHFQALLNQNKGDILKFMKAMNRIARRHSSPMDYLKKTYSGEE